MWKARENKFKKEVAAYSTSGARPVRLPDYELLSEHYEHATATSVTSSVFHLRRPSAQSESSAAAQALPTSPAIAEVIGWDLSSQPLEVYDWQVYQLGFHPDDSNPPSPSRIPQALPEGDSFESETTLDLGPTPYGASFEHPPSTANTTPNMSFNSLALNKHQQESKGTLDYGAIFARDPEVIRRQERRERIKRGEELPFDEWVGRRRPRPSPQQVVDQDLQVPWDLWNEKERHVFIFHTTRNETYTTEDGVAVAKGFRVAPRPTSLPATPKKLPAARRLSILAQKLKEASTCAPGHHVRFKAGTKAAGVTQRKMVHPNEHSYIAGTGLPATYYGSAPPDRASFYETYDGRRFHGRAADGTTSEHLPDSAFVAGPSIENTKGKGKAPITDTDVKFVKIVTSEEAENAIASDDDEEGDEDEDAWESVATTPEVKALQQLNKPALPKPAQSKKRILSAKMPKGILKKRMPVPEPPVSPPFVTSEEETTYKLARIGITPTAGDNAGGPDFPETPKSVRNPSPEVVSLDPIELGSPAVVTAPVKIKAESWIARHVELSE